MEKALFHCSIHHNSSIPPCQTKPKETSEGKKTTNLQHMQINLQILITADIGQLHKIMIILPNLEYGPSHERPEQKLKL